VLSTPIGDLTVDGNKLIGTGTNDGFQGLNLAPGPGLATDMYFRIHGGDNPTHLHLSVGDNTTYDQYWGDDNKYLKLDHGGNVIIGTNSKTWTFGDDGTTTFPDATVQTTAFKQGQITVTFVSGVNLTTITSLQLNSKNLIYCLNDPTYTTVEIQSIALPSPAAGQQLTIYNISPQTVALSWVDPRGGNSGYSLTSPGDVVCLQGIERQSSETGGDPGTDWIVVSTNNW
jgi:hypothetical protein